MLAILVLAACTLVLVPSTAYAWGPITHIVHGTAILSKPDLLVEGVRATLMAESSCYLYGCIGADIIQAKGLARSVATHCHSWPVAWKLVDAARSERERAFAWGYMTHLAADVLSHNHFVPSSLLRSFRSPALGHAYWEARVDALQARGARDRVRAVLRRDFTDCDELVERVVQRTLFSFKTNKRIFDSLMGLSKLDQWHGVLGGLAERSRYRLTRDAVHGYNERCVSSARDLLAHQRESATQEQDATGREALKRSTRIRRKLRTLDRNGKLTPALHKQVREVFGEPWADG